MGAFLFRHCSGDLDLDSILLSGAFFLVPSTSQGCLASAMTSGDSPDACSSDPTLTEIVHAGCGDTGFVGCGPSGEFASGCGEIDGDVEFSLGVNSEASSEGLTSLASASASDLPSFSAVSCRSGAQNN